ncbi:MAG: hypothetical protein MSH40_05080 [Christensenella sp.]|nr:hypothetical protein [Christensenella sp.]
MKCDLVAHRGNAMRMTALKFNKRYLLSKTKWNHEMLVFDDGIFFIWRENE